MPTYDWISDHCGETHAEVMTIEEYEDEALSENRLIVCSHGYDMRRRYAAPGVIFRGEGWAGTKVRA